VELGCAWSGGVLGQAHVVEGVVGLRDASVPGRCGGWGQGWEGEEDALEDRHVMGRMFVRVLYRSCGSLQYASKGTCAREMR